MKNKMVIAIYMRLSQEDNSFAVESNSIVNQRKLLCSYAAKHFDNYDLLEFQDDGHTGANFDRPGVTELLDKVRKGELDCILVKDLSRFSRDYIETGFYLEKIFPFAGIRFIAVNDGYDSERFKGGVAGMDTSFQNLMNDYYCKDISVKVKSALNAKKKKGIYANGRCTFGYQKAPMERNHLIIVEEEAAIIRRIFQMTLEGISSHRIAQQFNVERIKTPIEFKMDRGGAFMAPKGDCFAWSGSTICRILRDATYTGDMVYGKYEMEEVSGKARLKPRKEWKVFANHHEAIIDRDIFEYIQQSRGTKKAVKYKRHPLIGKMICGNCRKSLKIERTKNPYFFCGNRYVTRNKGCLGKINMQFLEQYVLSRLQEEVEKRLDMQSICKEVRIRMEKEWKMFLENKKKVSANLKDLQTTELKIYEAYVFEEKSRNDYIAEKKDLQEKIKQCLDRKKQIDKRIEILKRKCGDEEPDIYESLQNSNFAEIAQEMANRLAKRIVIHSETNIEIEWQDSEKMREELLQFQLAII